MGRQPPEMRVQHEAWFGVGGEVGGGGRNRLDFDPVPVMDEIIKSDRHPVRQYLPDLSVWDSDRFNQVFDRLRTRELVFESLTSLAKWKQGLKARSEYELSDFHDQSLCQNTLEGKYQIVCVWQILLNRGAKKDLATG